MRKRKIERERFASFSSGILFVVSCCSCKSCSCRLTHKSFILMVPIGSVVWKLDGQDLMIVGSTESPRWMRFGLLSLFVCFHITLSFYSDFWDLFFPATKDYKMSNLLKCTGFFAILRKTRRQYSVEAWSKKEYCLTTRTLIDPFYYFIEDI